MRTRRISRLACLALILVPPSAACATTLRGSNEDSTANEDLSITIENQSPASVVVYFTMRTGAPFMQLGRVPSIERRVFRVPVAPVNDATLKLRAIHDRTLHNAVTDYMTLPIDVGGVREVRWLIQDGRSLSPVTVR